MKKFASLLLALVVCLCCLTTAALAERAPVAKDDLKIGFIFLHDENSTYDLNFITAAKAACEKLGIAYETKTNIPEGQECYDAAAELADAGCDIIFADSFGHESYMIQAALEFPEVEFTVAECSRIIWLNSYKASSPRHHDLKHLSVVLIPEHTAYIYKIPAGKVCVYILSERSPSPRIVRSIHIYRWHIHQLLKSALPPCRGKPV